MKSLLVPLEEHALVHAMLDTALLAAARFGSYIEGAPSIVNLPVALPVDIAIGIPSVLDPAVQRSMADTSRKHFESFMAARGVPRAVGKGEGPAYGWRQGEVVDDAGIAALARVFDLTVVGRPGNEAHHPRLAAAEAVLFESGRPILVAPPEPPPTLGETVAIAWNASTETALAVAHAMPFLLKARRVAVLTVEGWGVAGPSGADLARSLRRHGIAVEEHEVANVSGRAGETILKAAAALGCDLLVKGAYTQSRLRQMILGGATSHILAHTTVPVLMAH